MTNREKLEVLKNFLTENKIIFKEDFPLKNAPGVRADLYVRRYDRIAVHLSDEHDQEFYNSVKRMYEPFFVRDNETAEFIIEKMQNTIIRSMQHKQLLYENMKKRELNK